MTFDAYQKQIGVAPVQGRASDAQRNVFADQLLDFTRRAAECGFTLDEIAATSTVLYGKCKDCFDGECGRCAGDL